MKFCGGLLPGVVAAVLLMAAHAARAQPIVGPLQTQNTLAEIAANGPEAQAAALANLGALGPGSIGTTVAPLVNGLVPIPNIPLNQPGGPAGLDATSALRAPVAPHPSGNATPDSTLTTTNGGVQPNAGDWSVSSGAFHLYGPDGAEVLRVGLGSSPATEFVYIVPGTFGIGGTVQSYSSGDASAPLNLVSFGAAPINLANGSGALLTLLDPGAPATASLTVTPGTAANAQTVSISAVGNISISPTGGVALGAGAISQGISSVAMGNGTRAFGTSDLMSGISGVDSFGGQAYVGARCHMSGIVIPSFNFGGNQICDQTLGVSFTGSNSTGVSGRMAIDGGTNLFGFGHSLGFAANGHGEISIKAECSLAGTSSQAYWSVDGWFTSLSGTLTFNGLTGTGVTTATGTLSTMTLSVSYDATNKNLNITPLLPSGVTTSLIYCTAHATWLQRVT